MVNNITRHLTLIILSISLSFIIPVSADCKSCDLFNLGTDYAVEENYELAITTFKEALSQADKEGGQDSNFYQWVWYGIGKNYDKIEESELAIQAYQKAITYPGSWDKEMLLWVIAKDYQKIAEEKSKFLPENPTSEEYKIVAEAFANAYSSWEATNKKSEEKEHSREKQQYYLNLANEVQNYQNKESKTGSLSLTTNPSGAQVTLDGSLQTGQTPLTLSDISAGSHSLTFSKLGYFDVSMTIPVIPDETSEFSISLPADSIEKTAISGDSQQKMPINLKESQGEDLIIDAIALVYYKPDSNDLSTDLTIENIGTASTARFSITYFLTPEQVEKPFMDTNGKEIILGRDEINTLGAGESRQASTMKTFSVSGVPVGTYWFGVFVDSQNSIAETNEENNVLYWEEQIII